MVGMAGSVDFKGCYRSGYRTKLRGFGVKIWWRGIRL
jgi:hypothetical protein